MQHLSTNVINNEPGCNTAKRVYAWLYKFAVL